MLQLLLLLHWRPESHAGVFRDVPCRAEWTLLLWCCRGIIIITCGGHGSPLRHCNHFFKNHWKRGDDWNMIAISLINISLLKLLDIVDADIAMGWVIHMGLLTTTACTYNCLHFHLWAMTCTWKILHSLRVWWLKLQSRYFMEPITFLNFLLLHIHIK